MKKKVLISLLIISSMLIGGCDEININNEEVAPSIEDNEVIDTEYIEDDTETLTDTIDESQDTLITTKCVDEIKEFVETETTSKSYNKNSFELLSADGHPKLFDKESLINDIWKYELENGSIIKRSLKDNERALLELLCSDEKSESYPSNSIYYIDILFRNCSDMDYVSLNDAIDVVKSFLPMEILLDNYYLSMSQYNYDDFIDGFSDDEYEFCIQYSINNSTPGLCDMIEIRFETDRTGNVKEAVISPWKAVYRSGNNWGYDITDSEMPVPKMEYNGLTTTENNEENNNELITTTPQKEIPKSIVFGTYAGNDMKWINIRSEGNKSLFITENIIDYKPFNESSLAKATDWEFSSIRNWLNSDFYSSSFSDDERNAINYTTVQDYKADSVLGNQTQDKVFVLSYYQAMEYFEDDASRIAIATDFAKQQTKFAQDSYWLIDSYSSDLYKKLISKDGTLKNCPRVNEPQGVRPAIWITNDYLIN